MTDASSAALIAVAKDERLIARAVALAATLELGRADVTAMIGRIACAPVNGAGDTVASVYEYASTVRAQAVAALPPEVGDDPAAVTDEYLLHALNAVFTPDPPTV